MACPLKNAFFVSDSGCPKTLMKAKARGSLHPSIGSIQFTESRCRGGFVGESAFVLDEKISSNWSASPSASFSVRAQASICVSKGLRLWEKTIKPNMVEINTALELVDSLVNAGDRLVIVDFYSPGCGGCKALHPKICQLADTHPNAMFLKVNYEQLKSMCHCLHIHVLPFFRFYRGSQGRLCSFSCTSATIKKFKDALVKYGSDHQHSSCQAKGLDEPEILNLASTGEIPINWPSRSIEEEGGLEHFVPKGFDLGKSWQEDWTQGREFNAVGL